MRPITTVSAILLFVILLFTGKAAHADEAFVDGTATSITYFQDARRIVSLAPNVTEMVYFLGLGDRLVGRSSFCNFPPEVANVEPVGGFVDTSLEKIISLDPDLVVGYQGNSLELITQLRQAGVPALAFNEATSIAEIGEQMSVLHRIATTGSTAAPKSLGQWNQKYQDLVSSVSNGSVEKPSCFFGYPGETSYTCGPGCFLYDLMVQAGSRPATSDLHDRWAAVSAEYIVSTNPDWLLTGTSCTGQECEMTTRKDLLGRLQADPVWSNLAAVKEKQIIVIDADTLLRPGPRILQALEVLIDEFSSEASGSFDSKEPG